jgi:hypothetical protein
MSGGHIQLKLYAMRIEQSIHKHHPTFKNESFMNNFYNNLSCLLKKSVSSKKRSINNKNSAFNKIKNIIVNTKIDQPNI